MSNENSFENEKKYRAFNVIQYKTAKAREMVLTNMFYRPFLVGNNRVYHIYRYLYS